MTANLDGTQAAQTDAAGIKTDSTPHNWLTQAVVDCYQQAKSIASDPYVEGGAALVATAGVLALNRTRIIPLAERLFAGAAESSIAEAPSAGVTFAVARDVVGTSGVIARDAVGATGAVARDVVGTGGVVARDAGGTAFVYRETPQSLGEQLALNPTVVPATATDRALTAKNWLGTDGAQYHFKSVDLTDKSWRHIYENEFPADERQDYDFLESLAAKDAVPHVTLQLTERNGETVAFSMLSDYGEGTEGRRLLLPYIAVKNDLQGMGIGTEHLPRLVEDTKAEFPSAKGMAVEVEDPDAAGITPAQVSQRMQRVNWYVDRHGAQLLDTKYLIPSTEEGAAPLPGRLLWIDFGRGGATDKSLHSLISSIYKNGYGLEENNPVVKEVLGKYSN